MLKFYAYNKGNKPDFFIVDSEDEYKFTMFDFYPCKFYSLKPYKWEIEKAQILRAKYTDEYDLSYNSVIKEISGKINRSYDYHIERNLRFDNFMEDDMNHVHEISEEEFKNRIKELSVPTDASLERFYSEMEFLENALVDMTEVEDELDKLEQMRKPEGIQSSRKVIKSSAGSIDTEQILESLSRNYFSLNDNGTRTCHFVNRNGKWFLIFNSAYDFRQNPDLGGNVTINADGSITVSGYRTHAGVVTNPDCDYAKRNIVLRPVSVNITKDELDAIVNKDMGDRSYGSVSTYDNFYNKIRNFFRN